MNLFETLRDNVTAREAAEYYGMHVGHNGMCNCIFHNDRNPSMKVDKRYFCFGCGATGDAVNLTAQLFGLSQKDAAVKLASDFGISVDGPLRSSARTVKPAVRQETPEEALQKWTDQATATLGAYRLQLLEWQKDLAPQDPDAPIHPHFSEALAELPQVDDLLAELLIADSEAQLMLKNQYGSKIEKLAAQYAQPHRQEEDQPVPETKKTNQERLKEITASIETGIQELFQSDKYKNYLRTMSRFHSYSVNNTVLIYLQKPDATLVAGFNRWKDQFQRSVNKGEHGIKIIAPTPYKKTVSMDKLDPVTKLPVRDQNGNIVQEEKTIQIPMFKPVTVFDVSQTSGKPLPQLVSDLTGNVQNYEMFMEALKRSSPVPIQFAEIASGADGFFSPATQSITIKEGMSEVQTVCAAVHEISHSKLHNYSHQLDADGNPAAKKDQRTEEVEAESIAFSVCAYYGIETGENSLGYIASWSKNKELPELKASLDTIQKTASELITDIDRNFAEIQKERGIVTEAPEQAGVSAAMEQETVPAAEAKSSVLQELKSTKSKATPAKVQEGHKKHDEPYL